METHIDRICSRLSENPAGGRVSFEKFIKNKGPLFDYEKIKRYSYMNIKGEITQLGVKVPYSEWYFRYIEKKNGEWTLPFLGNASKLRGGTGDIFFSRHDDTSSFYNTESSLSSTKILEEDSNRIILPVNSFGKMYFNSDSIARNPEIISCQDVNLSGILDNTIGLIIQKKDINLDIFLGGEFIAHRGGCFMTTACMAARGLPNNCIQLELLRGLRDNYMLGSNEGRLLVEQYYAIAPKIVNAVKLSKDSKRLLERGYREIEKAAKLTRDGNLKEATNHYIKTIVKFRDYCELSQIPEIR